MIVQLAWRIQNLQESIRNDKEEMKKNKGKKKSNKNAQKGDVSTQDDDDEPPPVIGLIDKKEIRSLSRGAEDTSSDSCCGDESEDTHIRRKRRTGLTTSMERSMRRLLRSTLKEKNKNKKKNGEGKSSKDSDDDIVDKDGKIRYDMRQYDLDTYVEILRSLHNIEFKPEEKK